MDGMTVDAGRELFALTDEQILGIEGAEESSAGQDAEGLPRSIDSGLQSAQTSARDDREGSGESERNGQAAEKLEAAGGADGKGAQPGMAVPRWLAERMKDPWNGEEARELWAGVQKAERDVGAYREVFATPEDARALKELYPGGVGEAKAISERARELAEIDAAYFGAARGTADEVSAGRARLAEKLMAQDPAAFREMVMAGVKLLEGGGKEVASDEWRVARGESRHDAGSLPGSLDSGLQKAQTSARDDRSLERGSREDSEKSRSLADARDDRLEDGDGRRGREGRFNEGAREGHDGRAQIDERTAAEYVGFEKAANLELERSVGGVIARTMEQALPNLGRMAGGPSGAELGERLKASVRAEVDSALKSDAALGEQVAKILAGRRFDEGTRGQVVRLIDARARQLVPGAVRKVVGDWTQASMAARRGPGKQEDAKPATERQSARVARDEVRPAVTEKNKRVGRMNYRALSDEEILEL